jgi:TM2 domain-containing membrane protein YozV
MKAAAVLVNFFLPGVGTMMVNKVTEGVIQFILGFVIPLILLIIPIIGWFFAIILGISIRIWAMVSAATAKNDRLK